MADIPSSDAQALLKAMESQSAAISKGLQGIEARDWMWPPGLEVSPLDPGKIADGFPRSDADEAYQEALNDGAPTGQAMAAKVELDYTAMMERSFRMRHLTPARAAAHAAARREGHGSEGGTHTGVVLQFITDLAIRGKLQEKPS